MHSSLKFPPQHLNGIAVWPSHDAALGFFFIKFVLGLGLLLCSEGFPYKNRSHCSFSIRMVNFSLFGDD